MTTATEIAATQNLTKAQAKAIVDGVFKIAASKKLTFAQAKVVKDALNG